LGPRDDGTLAQASARGFVTKVPGTCAWHLHYGKRVRIVRRHSGALAQATARSAFGARCSANEPQPATERRMRHRRHGLSVAKLPPDLLFSQRHRDTLGVVDRSAVKGGDGDSHRRKRTRRAREGLTASIPHRFPTATPISQTAETLGA